MFEAFLFVCLSTNQCFVAEDILGTYPTEERCIQRTQEIHFDVADMLAAQGIAVISATPQCNEVSIKIQLI